MYMAFTEEYGRKIRKTGFTVIEFKNCIRKGISLLNYQLLKVAEVASKVMDFLSKKLKELIDSVRLVIEDICDKHDYQTSRRYKFVKILDKLGYDKRKMWVATHHTWLARSNC